MNPLENSMIGKALGGLSSSSMLKIGIKYWWLAVPLGLASYWRYQERKKSNQATLYTVMTDTGMLVAPVAAIIMINEMMGQQKTPTGVVVATAAPAPSPSPISGQIKEAVFTAVQTADSIGPR